MKEKKDKWVLGSCSRTTKAVEHKDDGDISYGWRPWNGFQRPEKKKTERTGYQRKKSRHLIYFKIIYIVCADREKKIYTLYLFGESGGNMESWVFFLPPL